MFNLTIGMAKELIKSGAKLPKSVMTNIEDFIARGVGKLPIDTKYKKLVLGRGDIKDAKGNIKKQLSFKDTPGEKTGKKITKNTKDKAADKVKIGAALTVGAIAGPKFENAFQAAFGDSSSIFTGPQDMTMSQLRARTKKILKEKRAKSMKAAINKALKEVNTNKPKKRPTKMNKGGMVNDMRKSGLFR
jgi:hypothetical protein